MTFSPDLSQCVFVIEQALSVRALQELMASGSDEAVSTGAMGNGGAMANGGVMVNGSAIANGSTIANGAQ
jgi:hypothetical protein